MKMHPSLMLVLAFAASACSADRPTSPVDARTTVSGTYVLASMGAGTAAPFVTFDHVCGAARVHEQALLLGDTISLYADGTSRRGYLVVNLDDGAITDSTHLVSSGTWGGFDPTGAVFFGGHPSLLMNETFAIRTGGVGSSQLRVRVEADGSLSAQYATGGACIGSPMDAAIVTANYKPI